MAALRPHLISAAKLFRNADVWGLYLLLALGLLAPIASNNVLPVGPDQANHTALIVQAKQALDEGQFPIRVAPYQHDGMRYPIFQFYSSTPYLIGGLIYKYLTPHNPWVAMKAVYLVGICLAGIFTCKLGALLQFDSATSTLMGVVYVTSPYLLINIHPRGAYTEAFAQCVLPLLAYSSVRLVQLSPRFGYIWTSLAWLLLGTSHLITFLYSTGFYVALIVILYGFRAIHIRAAVGLLVAAILGWAVSAYQWFAAATVGPLEIHAELGNIFAATWLTPLSELLSLSGTPPEPLGRQTTPFLYPAVGVPILIAVAGLIYFRRHWGSQAAAAWSLLIAFFLAFFCVWSPVDFWALLPQNFKIAQFSYRFLIFTVAFGSALFGYFATIYKRRVGPFPFLAALVCLILFTGPYLPTLPRNVRPLESIIKYPDIGYGQTAYLYSGGIRDTRENYSGKYEHPLPLVYGDGWLMLGVGMPLARDYIRQARGALVISGTATSVGEPCTRLDLTLDDAVIATYDVTPVFEWRVPASVFQPFQGPTGNMAFESRCGFIPSHIDPKSLDHRRLWLRVKTLEFENPGGRSLPLEDVRQHCRVAGSYVNCDINTPVAVKAQLPILFYPSLLGIRENGHPVPVDASVYRNFTLAQVTLKPGQNYISAHFAGSTAGNTISLFGIVATMLLAYFSGRTRNKGEPSPASQFSGGPVLPAGDSINSPAAPGDGA